MQTVHLSSPHFSSYLFRQTPGNDGEWQQCRFLLEDPERMADWLVVYERHREPLETRVPYERRILMVSEPPEFQNYPQSYMDQFATLIAPYPIKAFKGLQIIQQTGLPWFYGMNLGGGGDQQVHKTWSELIAPTPSSGERRFEITAICSTKTQTKNQVRRLRFLKLLQHALGDRLRVFGRGFEPLDDKAEVIASSRHHIALENNLLPFGWTEKTADAILGGAFPIHGGAQEIEQDFNPDGVLWIDLTRPRDSIRKILDCLGTEMVSSEKVQQAMADNKRRLMHEHNLFAIINNAIKQLPASAEDVKGLREPVRIRKGKASKLAGLFKAPKPIRRLLWQMQIALFERN